MWHGKQTGKCLECHQKNADGSTWGQQANDDWDVGVGPKVPRLMHTKRMLPSVYDCIHGIPQSQCKEGCSGGVICEQGAARLLV